MAARNPPTRVERNLPILVIYSAVYSHLSYCEYILITVAKLFKKLFLSNLSNFLRKHMFKLCEKPVSCHLSYQLHYLKGFPPPLSQSFSDFLPEVFLAISYRFPPRCYWFFFSISFFQFQQVILY